MSRIFRAPALRLASLIVAGVLSTGCGGGNGDPVGPQQKPVATVSVSLAAAQIQVGQTTQATVVLRDADGATLTGRDVTWSSSATSVATVSQGGLVTSVAAGNANIVATSETKTGSAALTVVVDPASTANVDIAAIRQNGQSADLNNVAGVITIDVAETVPAGFNGTITVTIDTVLVSRTTFPAPAVVDAARGAAHPDGTDTSAVAARPLAFGTSRRNIDVNTASPIVTISGDDIAARGKLPNIDHVLSVSMVGTVNGTAISKSDQVNLRTANPSGALIGAGKWKNERVLLIDGRRFVTGESFTASVAALDFNAVPIAAIDRVEILHGDASAIYGSDAIAGVVNIITGRKREFSTSEFACESGLLGTKLQVTGIVRGTDTRDPRTNPFALNGVTLDADRDGFLDITQAPIGYNLGNGISSQVYFPDLAADWPADWFPLDGNFFCDNRGPTIDLGAFTAKGRITANYSAFDLFGGNALPLNNTIAPNYDLTRWIDLTKVSDKGTGLRATNPYSIYFGSGTTVDDIVIPANLWGGALPLNSNYNIRLGASFYDGFDNRSSTLLRTTTENPIGLSGTPTSAGQTASVRIVDDAGVLSSIGVRDRFWSTSTAYNPFYQFSTTGVIGTNEQYLTGFVKRNGVCAIGSGPTCAPVQLPAIRSGLTASVNFNTLLTQSTLQREGIWDASFTGYSSTGKPFTPASIRIRGMYDFTGPVTPTSPGNAITAPFAAGALIPFTMTATDNLHISQVGVSLRFQDWQPGGFERGYVEAPFVLSSYWSPWSNPNPTWTGTYSGAFPTRLALAQGGSGLVTAPYYNLTGYSMFSYDGVDRRSSFLDFPISEDKLPAFTPFNNLRVSISSNSNLGCLGRTENTSPCAMSALRKIKVTGVSLSPVSDNQGISQMYVFGRNNLSQVVRLCRALAPLSTTTVGPDTRIEFECEADMDDYKGPAGALTVFAWFISIPRWIGAKTQFLDWTLVTGSRGSGG